ncbi:MAG TPA: hypothetical protein VGP71_13250 [Burkholderiales bacterium]|nr:hypothetical protein [Burkholderiales bacterium]
MPGNLGDVVYSALQINVDGFQTPYVLTMALPVVGYKALATHVDPMELYNAIAGAINVAMIRINIPDGPATKLESGE